MSCQPEISETDIINLFGEPDDIFEYFDDNYNSKTYKYLENSSYTTINKYEIKGSRRGSRKVEKIIEKYSLELLTSQFNDDDEYLLLRSDFDDMIEDIKRVYISKQYLSLMSWLIQRAFLLTPQAYNSCSQTHRNKSILLKTLYEVNPSCLLQVFSKNA